LGSTPATRWYRLRLWRINTHEIDIYSEGGPGKAKRGCWQSQNSMADSSTTALPILDLSLGRRWARRQPHAGIRYVSGASILMKSLSTLGGGSWEGKEGMLAIPGLNGRFLHNHLTDPGSEGTGLLGSTLATCRYRLRLRRINIHEIVNYSGGGL